ncbi:MAG TPA: VOC family protein [Blastocatellia bacterium]|nr:VOC family protein [Blastocatellia bacterium]
MAHLIGWVDIPVTDLNRAISFYRNVTARKVEQEFGPEHPAAVFAHGGDDVAGCLFVDEEIKPSAQGPLLYFSVNGRLDEAVSAVEANGGRVIKPKHQIGPYGYRAIVLDSEGNRIALHSN